MRRRLGLTSAAALVVANMIGAGVFTTSGFALADLGRPEIVLLAWGIGGLIGLRPYLIGIFLVPLLPLDIHRLFIVELGPNSRGDRLDPV